MMKYFRILEKDARTQPEDIAKMLRKNIGS